MASIKTTRHRSKSETDDASRLLTKRRQQLQKRGTFPVIRNPGTSRELTMLIPEKKTFLLTGQRKTVDELSPGGDDFSFNTDLWEEEDAVDSKTFKDFTCQDLYLSACKKLSVVAFRQIWRQMVTSTIELEHHQIGPVGTKALALALVGNSSVTSIELRACNIEPVGLRYLLEVIEDNSHLRTLKVPGNHLRTPGAGLLGRFLKTNKTLRVIDVSDNDFEDCDARFFAEAIEENTALQELYVAKNRFCENAGVLLEKALVRNTTLTTLDLSWNHLRHRGSVALARCLQRNATLKTVNLSWNGFAMDGCYQMAKSLKQNKTLTELDLSSNRISFEACTFLLMGLAHNTSLKVLKIGQNPITSDGATVLIQTLLDRPSCAIRELDLTDVSVSHEFLDSVREIELQRPLKVTHGRVVPRSDHSKSRGPEVMNTDDPLLFLFEYSKGRNLRLIDLFKSLDKDKSETLTREEFRDGMKSVGLAFSNHSLDVLMKRLDANGDGIVDFEELMVGQKEYTRKAAKKRQQGAIDPNMALSELLKDKLRIRNQTTSRPQSRSSKRSS